MNNKFLKKGNTTVWVILVMLLVLGVTLYGLGRRVGTAPRAASSGGVGNISLTPASATVYPTDSFTSTLKFRTGNTSTDAQYISSLSIRITYSFTGTTPQLDVVDGAGNPTSAITVDPTLVTSGWSFPIKSVTRDTTNHVVTIDLAAIYGTAGNGFKSTCSPNCTDTNLATINFKANGAAASTLSFDTTQSVMMTKVNPPTDILGLPAAVTYTVQNDTAAPSAVANLASTGQTTTSVALSWSAPTDSRPQSQQGKAASYDLRYSTSAITAANFASATQATGEPTPGLPGANESMTVSGLTPNTPYFFAIESKDAAGNTSAISNVLAASTQNPNSTLTFSYKLQGINSSALAAGYTNSATVTLQTGTTNVFSTTVATTPNASGVFSPSSVVQLGSLPISANGTSYDVYIGDATHLRKKLGTLVFNFGANSTASLGVPSLIAGDFDGNNQLDGADIANWIGQYTALSVPTVTATRKYDVNEDGVISLIDIAQLLTNFNALVNPGD